MFMLSRKLANRGVLGLNRRNARYILAYNPRRLYPLVDDKMLTKKLAMEAGIAVPELYGVIEAEFQKRALPALLDSHQEFVIKPARGTGGSGILLISGRLKTMYRKIDGNLISQDDINHHISNILSGMYSLGGQTDKAMIEYRVHVDPVFRKICYLGVPDIRIIVFLGVPVMSMVRLPTRISEGKANLHQGAIGAGIDINTGITLHAVWRNSIVNTHPDTGHQVSGVRIPNWESLLHLTSQCYELTGLGYQGADIVLDKKRGPLMLELNARPGLNIQIANSAGLLPRLRLAEKYHKTLKSVQERVTFAQKHFAAALDNKRKN